MFFSIVFSCTVACTAGARATHCRGGGGVVQLSLIDRGSAEVNWCCSAVPFSWDPDELIVVSGRCKRQLIGKRWGVNSFFCFSTHHQPSANDGVVRDPGASGHLLYKVCW